jgi:phage head maturation protease
MTYPTESLVRALGGAEAISLRSADAEAGGGNTLVGQFAVYNRWTEINSPYEGHFMERVAPTAFEREFERMDKIKVLLDHGHDPTVGNKPLGVPKVLESRDGGAYYEVDLFDATYVNDLTPAFRAGQYGASFRFGIPQDGVEIDDTPQRSDHNPNGLPEHTLTNIRLYEFGPTTWGAYADATAGMRSGTDEFVERLLADPVFLARFVERAGLKNVEPMLETLRAAGGEDDAKKEAESDAVRTAELQDIVARRAAIARLR